MPVVAPFGSTCSRIVVLPRRGCRAGPGKLRCDKAASEAHPMVGTRFGDHRVVCVSPSAWQARSRPALFAA